MNNWFLHQVWALLKAIRAPDSDKVNGSRDSCNPQRSSSSNWPEIVPQGSQFSYQKNACLFWILSQDITTLDNVEGKIPITVLLGLSVSAENNWPNADHMSISVEKMLHCQSLNCAMKSLNPSSNRQSNCGKSFIIGCTKSRLMAKFFWLLLINDENKKKRTQGSVCPKWGKMMNQEKKNCVECYFSSIQMGTL